MISRRRSKTLLTGMVAAVVAVSLLSACAPTPEPEPTPTAVFASEEEAFAAAEETYRAYTEAQNQRRAGEESAEVLAFLVGRALDAEIAAQRRFKEQGIKIVGETELVGFAHAAREGAKVTAQVCIDATGLRALDASGSDVTSTGRNPVAELEVSFQEVADEMLISEIVATGEPC